MDIFHSKQNKANMSVLKENTSDILVTLSLITNFVLGILLDFIAFYMIHLLKHLLSK